MKIFLNPSCLHYIAQSCRIIYIRSCSPILQLNLKSKWLARRELGVKAETFLTASYGAETVWMQTQIRQRLWQCHSCETANQGSVSVDVGRAGAADCGSLVKRSGDSPSWPSLLQPRMKHPSRLALTPAEAACLPHVSPPTTASPPPAPQILNKLQRLPLSIGKYYYPSEKNPAREMWSRMTEWHRVCMWIT